MAITKLTTDQTEQERIAVQNTNNAFLSSSLPIGLISPFSGIVAPVGTMFTNGQAISRTGYSDLFSAITFTVDVTSMTSGSTTVTVSDTSNMYAGSPLKEYIEGDGIPSGTYIDSITDGTHIVLSAVVTATATSGVIRVFPYGNGDGSTTFNIPKGDGLTFVGRDPTQTEFNAVGKTGGSKYIQEHTHNAPTKGLGSETVEVPTTITGGIDYAPAMPTSGVNTLTTGNSGNLPPYLVSNFVIIYAGGVSQATIDGSLQDAKDYSDGKLSDFSATLADVATSGSYDDLTDTPVIDDSPTSGSDNPVKSGGVYTALESKIPSTDKGG